MPTSLWANIYWPYHLRFTKRRWPGGPQPRRQKGASFSGAVVECAHQVRGAPRHLGAAADDAAYTKSKLGAGYAGSKAASPGKIPASRCTRSTLLRDPFLRARARALMPGSFLARMVAAALDSA